MTRLLMLRILAHTWLARIVPYSLVGWVEGQSLALLAQAASAKPMLTKDARPGVPWLGRAVCQDIDCRHEWQCFAPNGVDPDIELECPACEQQAGVLV